MKKYIPYICHEIYRVEAVGLKSSSYTQKNDDFCEYVKFGAISWKFVILSITGSNLKILLHKCDIYNCDYLPHITICL